MRNSSKISQMLARISQGKRAQEGGKKGRTLSVNVRAGSKRWEEQQREADEILYGKKRRKR